MPDGYMGKLLIVDVSSGKSYTKVLSESLKRNYIGGRGLGSKLLLEMVPKGADPLGPKNALLFLTGPITGTIVPGGTKYVVLTKSPATGGFCDSYSSGKFAIEIKAAGYDGLVILGKSRIPSILVINEDDIRVVPAGDLWGQDTFTAEERLRELHGPEAGIICIGPAGENLVKFAAINCDFYRQAARGGVGTVMGSKRLKAVVVFGEKGVKCFDKDRLMRMMKNYRNTLDQSAHAQRSMKYGTPFTLNTTNRLGMLPVNNYQDNVLPEAVGEIDGDGFLKDVVSHRGCIGCAVACSKVTRVDKGEYAGDMVEGPEYETFAMLGANLGITDRSAIIRANILCDKLGIDTISTGNGVGFIMECFEKGFITERECGGLELKFGNYHSMHKLLEHIAYRKGIGNIIAEGVRYAAEKIGQGSEQFANHVKGLEVPGYDPRAGFGIALSYAVCPRGACHRRAWPPKIESLGEIPADAVEGRAEIVKRMSDISSIYHSMLACDFPCKMGLFSAKECGEFLRVVTGIEYEEKDLWIFADRVETTIRMFNNREGFGRAHDTLPPRFFKDKLRSGPTRGLHLTEDALNFMLDRYYELRGWDENGIPKDETLQ